MDREFGNVGRLVLEKQCRDLDINSNFIEPKDLARLARILSGLVSRFGNDRARRVLIEINNLIVEDNEVEEKESDEEELPRLFYTKDFADKIKGNLNISDVSVK